MKEDRLSIKDRETLLKVARQALINGVNGIHSEYVNPSDYSDELREYGATFVTLTKDGLLRGCIGSLEPYQSLVEDVWEHVVAAATQDFRFPPVKSDELEMIKIEISRLTKLQPLIYKNSNELQSKLRPGIDGVVIKDGDRRATFLPQV